MSTYDQDLVAWSQEQAHWLRIGQFSALDIEHLAEEIEDVGRSEQRELTHRMAILLAHLLILGFQSSAQSTGVRGFCSDTNYQFYVSGSETKA